MLKIRDCPRDSGTVGAYDNWVLFNPDCTWDFSYIQGCAQNDLSGGYLLAKLVQNCINVAFQYSLCLVGGAKLA